VRALRPASHSDLSQKTLTRTEFVEALSSASRPQAKKDVLLPNGTARPKMAQSNTLDGTWDKKIGTGRLTPDRTIDLHGYTLAAAHHRLDRGLDEAIRDGARVILLITGRAPRAGTSRMDLPLRGIIRESVGDWLAASRHCGAIAAVRGAHPRHGGAGALYIVLRRTR
jgi:DNA-nicking Smr family endonuclease